MKVILNNEPLLSDYGYKSYKFYYPDLQISEKLLPARVIAEYKSSYRVVTNVGELSCYTSGKYRYKSNENGGFPVVGDFVQITLSETGDIALIQELLPRKTMLYRKDNWNKNGIQVLASNFDTVFICMSLNRDFNISRLERYLILAKESKARIAVILTKSDLCENVDTMKALCEEVCGKIPVYSISSKDRVGIDLLEKYFAPGHTVVALGSSGVGKSSLVNSLYGEEIMKVADIRVDDDRGRHTTVNRQIVYLPNGGLFLDTPGIREIGIVDASEAVSEMFEDIETLMTQCRFNDCKHYKEPNCAVKEAIITGNLTEERYNQYLQFKKESSFAEGKNNYLFNKWQNSKAYSRNIKVLKKVGKIKK